MRTAACLICAALASASLSQNLPELFTSVKPDALITVEAAPTGAQYVTIEMVAENYPLELLRAQCQNLSQQIGSNIRGLEVAYVGTGVSPNGKPLQFARAHFAADNLADSGTGKVRLVPFARALAGNPPPFEVHCIAVSFLGYDAMPATLQASESSSAKVEGVANKPLRLLEYRILLKTQDASKIEFPETPTPQTNPPKTPSTRRVPVGLIAAVSLGAAAAGVLVYFALRPRRGERGNVQQK